MFRHRPGVHLSRLPVRPGRLPIRNLHTYDSLRHRYPRYPLVGHWEMTGIVTPGYKDSGHIGVLRVPPLVLWEFRH
jgi:hypothetical protein